jgi:enamine deaminase RidA (YjgF/YER057c/UK114 family)
MLRRITPGTIHPPFANYCHATEVPAGARWLYLSGQVGVRADGTVPESVAEQAALCFDHISWRSSRRAAWRPPTSCVSPSYLTDPAGLRDSMAVRDRYAADPPPASTLLVVQALARPQFRIEIEADAATYK